MYDFDFKPVKREGCFWGAWGCLSKPFVLAILFFVFSFVLWVAGIAFSAFQSAETNRRVAEANNSTRVSSAQTETARPTETPSPTPTLRSIILVPTSTPQPGLIFAYSNQAANIVAGPGIGWDVIGSVGTADMLYIIGKSADGKWLRLSYGGWISAEPVTLPPGDLPVMEK